MKKLEPPSAQLIRESFLPEDPNPMKNYRIKKVIEHGNPTYYVQRKILWFWWMDMYQPGHIIDGNPFPNGGRGFLGQGFFLTLEEAKEELRSDLKFNESRKRLSKTNPEYIYDLT
jgi:hypothetical protein